MGLPARDRVFSAFVAYQLYRYVTQNDIAMLVLSAFDLLVIALTWIEYRRLKRRGRDEGGRGRIVRTAAGL